MKLLKSGFPELNSKIINAIFDCVFGIDDTLHKNTQELLTNKVFNDFLELLLAMQNFNYAHRFDQLRELFFTVEGIIDFEINSDGTSLWMALLLAIKELYGLSDSEIRDVLAKCTIKK